MRQFVIEVLDTAEQITPEKALDILTFAFRSEVLTVREIRPTQREADGACTCDLQSEIISTIHDKTCPLFYTPRR